jgi:hypothetical protein
MGGDASAGSSGALAAAVTTSAGENLTEPGRMDLTASSRIFSLASASSCASDSATPLNAANLRARRQAAKQAGNGSYKHNEPE